MRRHYLRVTAEAHPGIVRRVDSLVRRAGLAVVNRVARNEPLVTHYGFLLSRSEDGVVADVANQLRELGRVEQTLWYGVGE